MPNATPLILTDEMSVQTHQTELSHHSLLVIRNLRERERDHVNPVHVYYNVMKYLGELGRSENSMLRSIL